MLSRTPFPWEPPSTAQLWTGLCRPAQRALLGPALAVCTLREATSTSTTLPSHRHPLRQRVVLLPGQRRPLLPPTNQFALNRAKGAARKEAESTSRVVKEVV